MRIFLLLLCFLLSSQYPYKNLKAEEKFNTEIIQTVIAGTITGSVITTTSFYLIKKSEKPVEYVVVAILGAVIGAFVSFSGFSMYYIISY
jgi:uncharacterized membrane protein YeaQ/YmgE (transglycosylase-associated protein family)